MVKCITAASEGQCFVHQNVVSSDKISNVWKVVKEQWSLGCATEKRTCIHEFPPKLIESEKPGFRVKV